MKNSAFKIFSAVGIGLVAVFIFSVARAGAYAIPDGSASSAPSGVGGYSFGGSFESLISPFESFAKSLQWTNSTPVGLNITPTTLPTFTIGSGVQNILGQWFAEFDDWVYRSTGVRLSAIVIVILNVILWTLHVAEDMVNWLLGLLH